MQAAAAATKRMLILDMICSTRTLKFPGTAPNPFAIDVGLTLLKRLRRRGVPQRHGERGAVRGDRSPRRDERRMAAGKTKPAASCEPAGRSTPKVDQCE